MTSSDPTLRRLAAIAVLMSLVACGGGSDSAAPSPDGGAASPLPPAPSPPAPPPPAPPPPAPPPAPGPGPASLGPTLSPGWQYSLALRADGSVLMLGNDLTGNLLPKTPVAGTNASVINGLQAVSVAAGYAYSLAVGTDGKLYGWGSNSYGTLGGTDVNLAIAAPRELNGVSGITMAVPADAYAVALRTDGTVWHWPGVITYGPGGSTNVAPGQIAALDGVARIVPGKTALKDFRYEPIAIKADGTVWTLGWTVVTVMGSSGPIQTSTGKATQVDGLSGVVDVACGSYHCLALLGDGSVASWGGNDYGQLGNGVQASGVTSPAAIPGLTGVKQIGATNTGSTVVTDDGRVLSWGRQYNGLGTLFDTALVPTLVVGLGSAVDLACDFDNCLVRLADGSLWGWGENGGGELGTGVTDTITVPTQAVGIDLD